VQQPSRRVRQSRLVMTVRRDLRERLTSGNSPACKVLIPKCGHREQLAIPHCQLNKQCGAGEACIATIYYNIRAISYERRKVNLPLLVGRATPCVLIGCDDGSLVVSHRAGSRSHRSFAHLPSAQLRDVKAVCIMLLQEAGSQRSSSTNENTSPSNRYVAV